MTEDKRRRVMELLEKNRAVWLILLLGLLLMLLPNGGKSGSQSRDAQASFGEEEEKLAAVLAQIEGVGQVNVLLRGEGPEDCLGAVVVCEGAESAQARLRIVKAVSAFTGLGSDRIIVLKMKS